MPVIWGNQDELPTKCLAWNQQVRYSQRQPNTIWDAAVPKIIRARSRAGDTAAQCGEEEKQNEEIAAGGPSI